MEVQSSKISLYYKEYKNMAVIEMRIKRNMNIHTHTHKTEREKIKNKPQR